MVRRSLSGPYPPRTMSVAVCIGNFDGVHVGHRALIERARAVVGADGTVVALSFWPHPAAVLRAGTEPAAVEPWEVRVERLVEAGADLVERLEPSAELLGMSPGEFAGWLVERFGMQVVVEGPDFRFGKGRSGDVGTLAELGGAMGFGVEVVPPVVVTLRDQSEVAASSTLARWLIGHGRVRDAAFVLGRVHELRGEVVRGDQLGRTIGFPTANLRTAGLVPGDGVYAGAALVPDGAGGVRAVLAAIHLGGRPVVNSAEARVEAYLMEADGGPWVPPGGMPEYGWACTLRVVGRVRDVVRLDGLEALKAQIARDCLEVRRMVPPVLGAGRGERSLAMENG